MDAMVVWKLPGKKKAYVVVEGNRRLTALRRLRVQLEKEKRTLEQMTKKGRGYTEADFTEQQQLVNRLTAIVGDTDQLEVQVVEAATSAELNEVLPRLMGVRHLAGVKQWGPYAIGLYILGRYEAVFKARYPKEKQLRLVKELVAKVSEETSTGETVTRRTIQAAAFGKFKRRFAE